MTQKADGSMAQLIESADTVINTSTEHVVDDHWFASIPESTLVILQANDATDLNGHVNGIFSVNDMIERYPLRELMWHGSLDCVNYTRFMIVGWK